MALGEVACLTADTSQCATGRLCPPGTRCTAAGDGCLFNNNRCGDGIVDDGEVCDDGNISSGDRCSADCQDEIAICGDGWLASPAEVCDDGNLDDGDGCSGDCRSDEQCGTGVRDQVVGEDCDDGNNEDGDGCSAECKRDAALIAGEFHICVLFDDGRVRCWGRNDSGMLGVGDTEVLGDNELPRGADDIAVGGSVSQLVAGPTFTCAVLDSGAVRCWG
ncbi:MAG: DUF4215 domain-containing protein, partial [Myxococcota bacterium]